MIGSHPVWAVLLAATLATSAAAQDRSQYRSMVISRSGIVAAESPLAAQAGADILAEGGNAVDAAVATNAVMGVVEPMMNGMGGDLFAIVYDAKTGKLYGINASGWAPAGTSIEYLRAKGITSEMPLYGIQPVTVPGAVDGWAKLLSRFGTKNFADVLAPAIYFAREGFPVPEWDAAYWADSVPLLEKDRNASATFLLDGHSPTVGQVFKNPGLAHSLELVASGGRDAYYQGEIAKAIVAYSSRLGGTLSPADFADYSSEWVEPISTTYRGWTIYELPPNGQGIAALEMLNIMEKFRLAQYGHNSVDALHVMIEAKKLAYADLYRYVADPRFSPVPVSGMLSKQYAAQRAELIDMAKANCDVPPGRPSFSANGDTTYLTVVDRDGNMVSLIQSNYQAFGSGLVADGTGFVLQDRGALFSLDPNSPNALAGRKRPLHTILPGFMTDGKRRISFGIMGGFNQAQAHAQFVSNVVDFGMNIQAAMEAARFTKLTFSGCDLEIEDRVPADVRAGLEKRGHILKVDGDFASSVGGGQAVERDIATGVNFGASDPRKDGEAIPEPALLK
ncbi:MAG TPA: gamma-glutamyltransferase [Candidatus Aquilonibacter sp.]|nr:gamma-glutamyltransferase [Candidatus Aquilonibacter sp.]